MLYGILDSDVKMLWRKKKDKWRVAIDALTKRTQTERRWGSSQVNIWGKNSLWKGQCKGQEAEASMAGAEQEKGKA